MGMNETKSKHYKSVFDNEQELIKALIEIHNEGKDIDCDPMYFKGNFGKTGLNKPNTIYIYNGNTKQRHLRKNTHLFLGI